jgi:hypothetical protein
MRFFVQVFLVLVKMPARFDKRFVDHGHGLGEQGTRIASP